MGTEDVKQHYNRAAKDRKSRLQTGQMNVALHNHRLRERVIRGYLSQAPRARTGIDIGTGTGVWAEVLCEHCDQVIGIDFAEENTRIATESAHELGLESRLRYELGDAQRLDQFAHEQFDVAVQISVLQHLPDPEAALSRIHAILRPGGYLILLVHNRACAYNHNLQVQRKQGKQVSVNEYSTFKELHRQLCSTGFRVVETRLNWLFLNDFLFLGLNRPALRLLSPVRKLAAYILSAADAKLGRIKVCAPLFREIVVLARKDA